MSESTNKQVKSRQRVADHGEVFTAEREVNAMLDLVKQETENIDSTFLEPACGNGNFLAEIIRRKLAVVDRKNYAGKRCLTDSWEMDSVKVMMSVYGVDLLQDNVNECRERLYNIWNEAYTKACKSACRDECRATVRFVLQHNILCGNALDLCCVDEKGEPLYKLDDAGQPVLDPKGEPIKLPIIFSEWTWHKVHDVSGYVNRADYRLDVLMKEHNDPNSYDIGSQLGFLDGMDDNFQDWMIDDATGERLPRPVDDTFRLVRYWEVQNEWHLI